MSEPGPLSPQRDSAQRDSPHRDRPHREAYTAGLVWVVAIAWVAFAATSVVLGRYAVATAQAIAALVMVGLIAATRRARDRAMVRAHGAAAATLLTIFTMAMLTGQGRSTAGWYLPLIGLIVLQATDWHAGVSWTVAGFAAYGLVLLSERFVTIEPAGEFGLAETALSAMAVAATALVYSAYTRRVAERHLEAQVQRERTVQQQAEELASVRDELAIAHREAIRASEAKSRLMARVSHELRTPLNGLIGLTEIMVDAKLPPAQAEILRTLRSSAATLLQLVNDLLDVTRLEEGRITIQLEATGIRELIGDVLDTYANVAERKRLGFAGVVDADVPEQMVIDPLRVRQVLSNLVNNALKFTDEGEVTIRVHGRTHDEHFDGHIDVEDTGAGIAESKLSGLFEAYEQLEDPLPLRRQGSGLGLWIAREIAEALGGELGVESTPGEGSTFSIRLKALLADSSRVRESGLAMVGLRVLAIEPHRPSREALAALAAFEGIDLATCASLDALPEGESPGVVIVDSVAGGPNLEATGRRLKARFPKARLVLGASPSHVGEPPPSFSAMTLKPYRASRLRAVLFDVLPAGEGEPEPTPLTRRMRVLVVDDDPTNRMVARLFLEKAGQEVELASTAKEAWTALSSEDFDIAFVDVHLPDESGLSLASHVRQKLDPARRLWMVALTAAATEEDRKRCFEAGMDDFVAKPIQVGLFRAALERAHRMSRRRRRTTSGVPSLPHFDQATFDALADALEEDIVPLVEEYLENGEKLLAELRRSLPRDKRTAHRAAHTLASGSAMLGARSAASIARAIETAVQAGATVTERDLASLESAFAEARRTLQEIDLTGQAGG